MVKEADGKGGIEVNNAEVIFKPLACRYFATDAVRLHFFFEKQNKTKRNVSYLFKGRLL